MIFRITLEELLKKQDRTAEEENFVHYYYERMPLGTAPCTVNKICWKIESIFDDLKIEGPDDFDYSILKSNVPYSDRMYAQIKKIYDRYRREASDYMQYARSERIKPEDRQMQKYILKEEFKRQCLEQCPNEEILCNIVLDLCYAKSNASKQFAWDICGETIIRNLLRRNHNTISYPTLEESGEIEFAGMHFTMKTARIKAADVSETEVEE